MSNQTAAFYELHNNLILSHEQRKHLNWVFLFVLSAPYYIQLNLRNNASDDVILKWKSDGQTNEFEIPKGENVDRIIRVTGASRPKHTEFSAVGKSSKVSVNLNGKGLLSVSPTKAKTVTSVLIGDGMISPFVCLL